MENVFCAQQKISPILQKMFSGMLFIQQIITNKLHTTKNSSISNFYLFASTLFVHRPTNHWLLLTDHWLSQKLLIFFLSNDSLSHSIFCLDANFRVCNLGLVFMNESLCSYNWKCFQAQFQGSNQIQENESIYPKKTLFSINYFPSKLTYTITQTHFS